MSAAMMVSFRQPVLAWAGSIEDDLRFNRVLRSVLIICTLLSLLVLLMPLGKPDRSKAQELPPRLAKMLLENAKPPPTPKPKPEAVTKPDVPSAEQPSKEVLNKEAPVPDTRAPQPNKPPAEIDAARRKAASVGLLAMVNDLAELRGAPMAVQLTPVKQGVGVGVDSSVVVGAGAGNEAGVPARALITSNASGGSGGINTSGYSKNIGGAGLAGRSTTRVEAAAGGDGGKRAGGSAAGSGARGRGDAIGNGKASRSIEEIRMVFDRNSGAINSIYMRALREEPSLQGEVVLSLTISPAGNVVDCRIVSSGLKAPELEAKLLARIRQFDFGAKSVDQMVIPWSYNFQPS